MPKVLTPFNKITITDQLTFQSNCITLSFLKCVCVCVCVHMRTCGMERGYFTSHHGNTISCKDYATASTHQKHFPLPIILQDFKVWPSIICHLLSTFITLVTSICWFSHHILIKSYRLLTLVKWEGYGRKWLWPICMIWKKRHPKSHMGYPDLWTWPESWIHNRE